MRDRMEARQGEMILKVRQAQSEAARSTFRAAEEALREQEALEAVQRTRRDEELRDWQVRLQAGRFDPLLLRLGGAALLERERQLSATKLDTAIVRQRQVQAEVVLGTARAQVEASRELQRRVRREIVKDRDERQTRDIEDIFLQRGSRS